MEYQLYKFIFNNSVHFGDRTLENTNYTFGADTLFSALCIEALKCDYECMENLLKYSNSGELLISDAFPYIKDVYYLPKPILKIESDVQGDSAIKKAYKNLEYIEADSIDLYLAGRYNVLQSQDIFARLGKPLVKVSASVRGEEVTRPYHVGLYTFSEGNGLYVIIGYQNKEAVKLFDELLKGVSLMGIGGRRSSGLGRFAFAVKPLPEELHKRLEKNGEIYMLLSAALPKDNELGDAIEGASYLLERRSGFVLSPQFSPAQMRKKDLYVFKSGSCFKNRFEGDIYDVSAGNGLHPVYRYAKPFFMEAGI